MRKRFVFTVIILVAFAIGVKAQSTWDHPWPGATHHYTATVTDAENDNPVRWYVATDASGNTKAVYNTDYTFVTSGYNPGDDQLEGTAVYDVQITWGSGLAANTDFYVVLEVDDGNSHCPNRMTLHVQVEVVFNALVYDVTGSAIPGTVIPGDAGDDTVDPTCPGDVVNPLWDNNTHGHTDIGNSELVFRIERENSLLGWQFEFDITEAALQSFSIDSIKFVDDLSSKLTVLNQSSDLTSGEVSVNDTKDWVLAYVYIRNQMGVTLNLNFGLITVNNLTKDIGNNLDGVATDNNDDHTIQPMPVITNFSGN